MPSTAIAAPASLTRNQIRGFWAAWGGWTLDGMDSSIFSLVLAPALTQLLPASGILATPGNIGFYAGALFAVFLIGWGFSMIWGPIADRFGRVRTLALTILCYSIFTLLCGISGNIWQLAACRFFAGVGIGGEWSMGGTFIAEEWPEDRRQMGGAYMHTGYYFGLFLAALANYFVGAKYGWRWMFVVGGAPALMVGWIRQSVHESERWTSRTEPSRRPAMSAAFFELFSPEYTRRTLVNAALVFVSIVGLWAGSYYVPLSVTQIAAREGHAAAETARYASYGTMVLAAGTILGCLMLPPLADRVGRRLTLALYFGLMFLSVSVGFGYIFYLPANALAWFFAVLFILGVGGANFAMYTLWLPEQYTTSCRASAFAFATSAGRFLGAGITFLVGAGISRVGTVGIPVAITSVAFLIGMALLPLAEETRGRALPD